MFYGDPIEDTINIGINATPANHDQEIIEDADKLVPAKDLEIFAQNNGDYHATRRCDLDGEGAVLRR